MEKRKEYEKKSAPPTQEGGKGKSGGKSTNGGAIALMDFLGGETRPPGAQQTAVGRGSLPFLSRATDKKGIGKEAIHGERTRPIG